MAVPSRKGCFSAAKGLGVSRKALSGVRKAFGGSAESWLRQQMQYDLWQVQKQAGKIKVKRFEFSPCGYISVGRQALRTLANQDEEQAATVFLRLSLTDQSRQVCLFRIFDVELKNLSNRP